MRGAPKDRRIGGPGMTSVVSLDAGSEVVAGTKGRTPEIRGIQRGSPRPASGPKPCAFPDDGRFVRRLLCRCGPPAAPPRWGVACHGIRALHHLVCQGPGPRRPRIRCKCAGKLCKIKHLHRRRGAADYRGQTAARTAGGQSGSRFRDTRRSKPCRALAGPFDDWRGSTLEGAAGGRPGSGRTARSASSARAGGAAFARGRRIGRPATGQLPDS